MAEVDLSPLTTSLEKVRLGETGQVFLFDNQGTLVGSKIDGATTPLNFSTWKRVTDVIAGESFTGMLPGDRYESPLLNTPVVSSALRIKDLNWALLTEWPTTESDVIIENFRKTVLLTIFISIVMVLLVASFIANLLVKPIKLLQNAANEIQQGNFDKQVSITTNNELEDLGESFNGMSAGLKRLEELKNEFVYVAAHELRAPVTAIKGYMELIFDGDGGTLTPELEHLLAPVKRSNERLVNLVNDLLKVARSEAGKLEIAISPSNINVEVQAILDEIRPLALKRNMTVIYNHPENLPLVMVNTGNFKEIIMNFASNAVKYGNDNGTITVSHEIKGGMVATSIADNGRGMSEEDQKHLFQKFFRASDVKKTDIEGTGLGLFITKELVEKMGGTLMVTSTLGVGTTFTVAFKQTS
jgi:signal transduction histidine kinase